MAEKLFWYCSGGWITLCICLSKSMDFYSTRMNPNIDCELQLNFLKYCVIACSHCTTPMQDVNNGKLWMGKRREGMLGTLCPFFSIFVLIQSALKINSITFFSVKYFNEEYGSLFSKRCCIWISTLRKMNIDSSLTTT